jgi:hypothetical protein
VTTSLIVILLVFFAIMVGVLAFCLGERRRALAQSTRDAERDQAADTRVALILFGAIIVGAALALITAYVVFFRQWT